DARVGEIDRAGEAQKRSTVARALAPRAAEIVATPVAAVAKRMIDDGSRLPPQLRPAPPAPALRALPALRDAAKPSPTIRFEDLSPSAAIDWKAIAAATPANLPEVLRTELGKDPVLRQMSRAERDAFAAAMAEQRDPAQPTRFDLLL